MLCNKTMYPQISPKGEILPCCNEVNPVMYKNKNVNKKISRKTRISTVLIPLKLFFGIKLGNFLFLICIF